MKTLTQITGRLTAAFVLIVSLITNLRADTYYSAKDPDLVPLPFNPHPECTVTELEKGIFVVDDTLQVRLRFCASHDGAQAERPVICGSQPQRLSDILEVGDEGLAGSRQRRKAAGDCALFGVCRLPASLPEVFSTVVAPARFGRFGWQLDVLRQRGLDG